jgi:glycosyltransferase involved in cell wall biosynthesis
MTFSVIIPSYLAQYPGSAKDRDKKLVRAVNSVLSQSFTDFEIHVIADGCKDTMRIMEGTDVKLWYINHKKLWSGLPRNKGIEEATGDWIIYLDIDDVWGEDHLKKVFDSLVNYDWVWFNDLRWNPRVKFWYENQCNIKILGKCGTSNICHKRSLGMSWDEDGRYAHDFYFIKKLMTNRNFTKIATPEYFVCHLPGKGGYDI